jgi:SAM-dependent methyltransferase
MMWKLRYYLPLVGFVLPTLVIGYGFVIPCSCIKGINELSVGFGSTVFGAVLTYFAGIRSATATACPARPPLRVRFARYLNRQAAHPRGWFGRLLGFIWRFEHQKLNEETLDLLEVRATDRVLDVGCGSGTGVRLATSRVHQGHVTGIDVSEAMLDAARRRNRRALRAGRVSFAQVEDGKLGLADESFDRAYSVHCLYFWKDPRETLRQLAAALRPGGRLVLAFRPDGPDLPARFRDATYRFYAPAEIAEMVASVGFTAARIVTRPGRSDGVAWVIAER